MLGSARQQAGVGEEAGVGHHAVVRPDGLARDVPMWDSFRGVMPFLISDLLRIVLLVAFPGITLGLVRALG